MFGLNITLKDDVLFCPKCEEEYLHSRSVTVFSRGEDEKMVDVTRVQDGGTLTHRVFNQDSENPSLRRHGIKIGFECEACNNEETLHYLNLVQHKGQTFIYWDKK